MDIETLQLMLEMGPEAAGAVKAFVIAQAFSGVAFAGVVFGFIGWGLNRISRSFMLDELEDESKQEYLRRKFKVGKPNEETPTTNV